MPKFYTKDDLIPLYVKGIKKQPIKLIKNFVKYLKINPFFIKYIFFQRQCFVIFNCKIKTLF